jgi:hypothetical protein
MRLDNFPVPTIGELLRGESKSRRRVVKPSLAVIHKSVCAQRNAFELKSLLTGDYVDISHRTAQPLVS